MTNRHWLLQWLDSYAVTSPRQADELLKKPHALSVLREEVEAVRYHAPMIADQTGNSIVAGSEIDLSGNLICSNWQCIRRQVDELFSSIWHYFDRIIVAGPSAHFYNSLWESGIPDEQIIEFLTGHIRVLLHVRNIGAEDIVVFSEKPRAWCAECLTPLVRALGVNSIEDFDPYVNHLIDRVDKEAHMEFGHTDRVAWYTVEHPTFFEEPYIRMREGLSGSEMPMPEFTRRDLAKRAVRDYVEALLSDLGQAQNAKVLLGTTLRFYKQILHKEAALADEAVVAFQMDLPILQGVNPEILLKIRHDEKDHFDAFRNSLRIAIKERLQESATTDPKGVAQEIRRDVIDPAINDIERRLNTARSDYFVREP